jgi:hypothetical protein
MPAEPFSPRVVAEVKKPSVPLLVVSSEGVEEAKGVTGGGSMEIWISFLLIILFSGILLSSSNTP